MVQLDDRGIARGYWRTALPARPGGRELSGGARIPDPLVQPFLGGPDSQTNLMDILERVLDKGIVIAGDIQINLLDIVLLNIKPGC